MHCHLCITRDLYQRELYTQGKKKTSVRKQFFEKWNRYFLISYLFILISQCIKYTYSTNVYSTCTTCTHTTSCTSIQQTTNLGLHARTVLSDLEITWCFEVEFLRSFIGFTVNWCLLNWLQLIRLGSRGVTNILLIIVDLFYYKKVQSITYFKHYCTVSFP